MSDLIERLHDVASASRNHDGETDALIDAADEIERLTNELREVKLHAEALLDGGGDEAIYHLRKALDNKQESVAPYGSLNGLLADTEQERDDER